MNNLSKRTRRKRPPGIINTAPSGYHIGPSGGLVRDEPKIKMSKKQRRKEKGTDRDGWLYYKINHEMKTGKPWKPEGMVITKKSSPGPTVTVIDEPAE